MTSAEATENRAGSIGSGEDGDAAADCKQIRIVRPRSNYMLALSKRKKETAMTSDNQFLKAMNITPTDRPIEDPMSELHRIERDRLKSSFAAERDALFAYIEHLKASRERLRVRSWHIIHKHKRRADYLYLSLFTAALVIAYLVVKG